MPLQVGVLEVGRAAGMQSVAHPQNDVPSALAGVEDAGAIAEPAGLRAQFVNLPVAQIECHHRGDDLRHLLPVSAHVLHRRSAHAAGNAAEALHAGAIAGHRVGHEPVPLFAGAYIEDHRSIFPALFHPAEADLERQPRPPGIRDHQIAAAAQHEQRQAAGARKIHRRGNVIRRFRLSQKTRRSSHLECGQRRERNIFLNVHSLDHDDGINIYEAVTARRFT